MNDERPHSAEAIGMDAERWLAAIVESPQVYRLATLPRSIHLQPPARSIRRAVS